MLLSKLISFIMLFWNWIVGVFKKKPAYRGTYLCKTCGSPDPAHKVAKKYTDVNGVVHTRYVCDLVYTPQGTRARKGLKIDGSKSFGKRLAKKTFKKLRATHGKKFAKRARSQFMKEMGQR